MADILLVAAALVSKQSAGVKCGNVCAHLSSAVSIMLNLAQSAANPRVRRAGLAFVAIGAAVLMSACGSAGVTSDGGDKVVAYQYRKSDSFVRLERIEPGAPANSHPYRISTAALRQLLAGIQMEQSALLGSVPVFTQGELDEVASPLAAALEQAGPNEDVTFATSAPRGLFGAYSRKAHTTGRVFAQDSKLNIVFGVVHERFDDERYLGGGGRIPELIPGSRTKRVGYGWRLVPGGGQLAGERADWVMFDQSAVPLVSTPSLPTPQSTQEGRFQEIETRLKLLEQLKAKGLITDEEYRERRRAILQGI
jgi:hypothetical protein